MIVSKEQYEKNKDILARYNVTCEPQETGLFAQEPKPNDASTAGNVITLNELMQIIKQE